MEKQEIFLSILFVKLFISIIILTLFLFFSESIAQYFFNNEIQIVFITGIIFLIGGTNILCQFYFRSLRKTKIYSFFRIIDNYSKLAIAYYMIIIGKGIYGALLGYLGIEIVLLIIYLIIIFSEMGFSIPHFSGLKSYLKYGIPLIPTGISLWIIMFSDRYVISYLMPFENVGIYSASYNIGFLFFMVVELFDFVLVPTIAKSFDDGLIEDVKKYLRFVLKMYLILALPAIVGLSLLSKQILTYFTTEIIAYQGWLITPLIALSSLFAGLFVIYDKTLRMTKKTSLIGIIVTITAAINIILNFIWIPKYGILGAAYATLFSYICSFCILIFFSVREIKFGLRPFTFAKIIFASVLIGGICYVWSPETFISLISCILTCIVSYFVILYGTGGIKKEELSLFFQSFQK